VKLAVAEGMCGPQFQACAKVRLGLAVPWLRLVADLSPRRPRFAPGSAHVEFEAGKVTQGQVLSEYFGFRCHSTVALHCHISSGYFG
jgi:hypothetical protein